jgi:hypothetical protein
LEIHAFGINDASHVALMAVAFVCGLKHIGRKAELNRKTTNAIMAFSSLPLLTVTFAKAEAIKTTSCKLVSLISLSIAFLPLAIAFKACRRATPDTSRAKKRMFILLLFFWLYICFIFPESLCLKRWSESKTNTFNLIFDLVIAFSVCDLVWSLR